MASDAKTTGSWLAGGRGRPPRFRTAEQKLDALRAIRDHGVNGASARLGVSRPTLQRLVKEFNVRVANGRRPGKK